MDVTGWKNNYTYGIRVGADNRGQYFIKGWSYVRVELDGEYHKFNLTKSFWAGCPEIRDSDRQHFIRDWLRNHKRIDWPENETPTAKLIPVEGRKFRLEP